MECSQTLFKRHKILQSPLMPTLNDRHTPTRHLIDFGVIIVNKKNRCSILTESTL